MFIMGEISIHALHEESDYGIKEYIKNGHISIHALHEESDEIRKVKMLVLREFQSTLSMRRATDEADDVTAEVMISIHALHEESDMSERVCII